MRHVGGLLFGIIAAPAIWLLSGFGIERLAVGVQQLDRPEQLIGAGVLAAAGLFLGLLLGLRTSPVGPLVAALAFLAAGGYYLVEPGRALSLRLPSVGLDNSWLVVPFTAGVPFLIGVACLLPLFSASRWRRRFPAAAAPVAPGRQPGPVGNSGFGTPGGGSPYGRPGTGLDNEWPRGLADPQGRGPAGGLPPGPAPIGLPPTGPPPLGDRYSDPYSDPYSDSERTRRLGDHGAPGDPERTQRLGDR